MNCIPRARLNTVPTPVFLIFVGNSSENNGPNPPKNPVPNPVKNINIYSKLGIATIRFQHTVIIAMLIAIMKLYIANAGRLPSFSAT